MASNKKPETKTSSGKPRDEQSSEDAKQNPSDEGKNNDTPTEPPTTASGNHPIDGEIKGPTKKKKPFWANKKNKSGNKENAKPKDKQDDVIRFTGRARGSKPVRRAYCHNLEHAQFPLIVRQAWELMVKLDHTLTDSFPFPMFMHYCSTILNAFIMDYAGIALKIPELLKDRPVLEQISATDYKIPTVIYDYISAIGSSITPNDDIVRVNIPTIAIPEGRIGAVDAGTFGVCNAARHNVYECYVSPYVTRRYVEATIANNNADGPLDPNWEPLPDALRPAGGIPNENLLGYFPIEAQTDNAIAEMEHCEFAVTTSSLGRICYSENIMQLSGLVMNQMSERVNMSQCDFKFRETAAIFLTKESITDERIPVDERIADVNTKLSSPFAFGSSTANRAHWYGFKRVRSEQKPGPCYTIDGGIPPHWADTCNRNYTMTGLFTPVGQMNNFVALRDGIHFESSSDGRISQDLSDWLYRLMLKK